MGGTGWGNFLTSQGGLHYFYSGSGRAKGPLDPLKVRPFKKINELDPFDMSWVTGF